MSTVKIEPTELPIPVRADMAEKPVGLIGFARRAGRDLLSVIPEETRHQTYLKGPARIHYICDPAMISEMLVTRAAEFPKSQVTKNILGSAIGNGMLLSEGDVWKAQRKRYAPLFAARNLPVLTRHFARTGQALADGIAGGEVDVAALAQEATLTNITRAMFSGDDRVDPSEVREGLRRYNTYVGDMSLFDLMGLPAWVPRLKWLKSRAPVTRMRDLARQVIEGRQAEARSEPRDFLDLMIAALNEDGEDIEASIDNLLTFVVAGHETAANTLAWGLYLLSIYPEAQQQLRAEVRAACGDRPVPFEALEKMPLLAAHVNETLRLYPAAAFTARDVAQDGALGDVALRKGDALFLPIYALHRHEALWDEPQAYRPDRFLEHLPPRGQFIPFGDGPRVCIGAQYARTEIMILLASILRQIEVLPGAGTVPRPVVTFTLRPDGPLRLNLRQIGNGA
ncbi:cytochrome P450 [Roseovarius sp. 2305UL8-3]|uniref:cytochrome P450 n=1 Tax=Roseovarius conchicola TaxID=3121636 RepID=UPI00352722CF